jgi:hypothetical protein
MFITKTTLDYYSPYLIDYRPPEGSYLVASPSGWNSPYLRGTLVVPDGTDIPQVKQSLLSTACSQHNTYHHHIPPIAQGISPAQYSIENRYTYLGWFRKKLFPTAPWPQTGLKLQNYTQPFGSYERPAFPNNANALSAPEFDDIDRANFSYHQTTGVRSMSNMLELQNQGVSSQQQHQEKKMPLFAVNVPTVIISQYNSIPEQQMAKTLPYLGLSLISFFALRKLTSFPRSELHEYLSRPELSPLPLQKAIASALGYSSKLRTSILSLSLLPLLEIPFVSAVMAPVWGNISGQIGGTSVPYQGVGDNIKILTQSDYKMQFLRNYHHFYEFSSPNDFFIQQNDAQIVGIVEEKKDTTQTTPSTIHLPPFPGLTREQLNEKLESAKLTSQTIPKKIPSKMTIFSQICSQLLKTQKLSHYDPTPYSIERLDDQSNIPESSLIPGAIHLPTSSAASSNITAWRQATNLERILVGTACALIAGRVVFNKQVKFNKNSIFYSHNVPSSVNSEPTSSLSALLSSRFRSQASAASDGISKLASGGLNTMINSGTYIRHLIPTLYPTFRFSGVNLPYSLTSPLDHPTAKKMAKKFPYIESNHLFTSSVQYPTSFIDRSFAQGQSLVKDVVTPSKFLTISRLLALMYGLSNYNTHFTTEDYVYDDVTDPNSGHFLYDVNEARPKDEKKDDKKDEENSATPTPLNSNTPTNPNIIPDLASIPVQPQTPLVSPTTFTPSNPRGYLERAHAIFTSSNSTPNIPAVAALTYTALLMVEINTTSRLGYSSPHLNKFNVQLELAKLHTDPTHRHPPTTTIPFYKVSPTPERIKNLLTPVMRLYPFAISAGQQTSSSAPSGAVFSHLTENITQKAVLAATRKERMLFFLLPLFVSFLVTKKCYLPTFDFIKGNNNGPHPYSESLFAEHIANETVEDEIKPILNTLRHNGISHLFTPVQTVATLHPSAAHHVPDENEKKVPTPVVMIQLGYKHDISWFREQFDKNIWKPFHKWSQSFTWPTLGGGGGDEPGGDE